MATMLIGSPNCPADLVQGFDAVVEAAKKGQQPRETIAKVTAILEREGAITPIVGAGIRVLHMMNTPSSEGAIRRV